MAITGLERTYDIYSDREDLEDVIAMISPTETPLFSSLNRTKVTNVKHEWLEDSLAPMTATIATAVSSDTDTVTVTLSSGHGARFRADSSISPAIKEVIRVNEELMLVTDESSNELTCTRAYQGSSVAAHAVGDIVEILGPVDLEGADAKSAEAQTRSRVDAYTQYFSDTVQVSSSQEASIAAGMTSEADYQLQQRLKELAIKVERFMINGYESSTGSGAGSASAERMMRGLVERISTNTSDKSSAVFTESHLETAIKTCFDAGGNPNIILCNSAQALKIQDWYKGRIRTEVTNNRGGIKVNVIESIFASELAVLVDRWVPQHEVYVLDGSRLSLGVLFPFRMFELAKSGGSTKLFVEGEYTVILKNESAHYRIYGLATS